MGPLERAAREFQDTVLAALIAEPDLYPPEAAEALREVVHDLVMICQRIEQ